MNRKKQENEMPINYDLSPFMPHNMNRSVSFENSSIETLHEKLQIKSEALNLLAKQLELCNKEKNEYKRVIDTLYEKNLLLKKSLYFKENEIDVEENKSSKTFNSTNTKQKKENSKFLKALSPKTSATSLFSDIESEDYMKILKDMLKTLQKEKLEITQKYEECQQELQDSRSDLRLLREQIVRQRIGSLNEGLTTSIRIDSASTPSSSLCMFSTNENPIASPALLNSSNNNSSSSLSFGSNFRENLIKEIEMLREQKILIENDLKLALCQKEEIEIECDSFKAKYNKLNEFLLKSSSLSDTISSDNSTSTIASINNENIITDLENSSENGKQTRIAVNKFQLSLNVDELISQNKYLVESNQNLKQELELTKTNLKKLKQAAGSSSSFYNSNNNNSQTQQSTKTDLNFLNGQFENSKILSKKNIENLMHTIDLFLNEHQHLLSIQTNQQSNTQSILNCSLEHVIELKLLAESLLENLNDKIIANAHQRKVNRMLANRIQDLEIQVDSFLTRSKCNSPISIESSPQPASLLKPLMPEKSNPIISKSSYSEQLSNELINFEENLIKINK